MTPLDHLRLEKAGADCGFELTACLTDDGALELRSAAFPETLWVSTSPEVAGGFRMRASAKDLLDGGADDCLDVSGYGELYAALQRASAVARTMPNRVADKFRHITGKLPQSTEAERMVVQRVGQNVFRDALLDYWQGECCVTGLAVPSLLRASHIKPWAKCASDDERLDVFNGLLLAPHLDALFDDGWISFSDGGSMLISTMLSVEARKQLGIVDAWQVERLTASHSGYLAFHRQQLFRS